MNGEAPPPPRHPDRHNAPPPPPTLLVPPPYDPALEPAIEQLLDRQAEIHAKLAQLLPQKYGPNIKIELDMLRHKLLGLEAYATDNRELPFLHLASSGPPPRCISSQSLPLEPGASILCCAVLNRLDFSSLTLSPAFEMV